MKRDSKPYDTAFKDLAEQAPELLLRLIGALPPGATVRLLPREVSAPALLTDQPYEVSTASERFVTHIEAQTRYRDNVPARLVEYGALLWISYRLPVRSYVLVLIAEGMPAQAPTTITIQAGGLTLMLDFTIVKLWELPAAEALAWGNENLLPFVPLMAGGRAELEPSAQALGQVPDEKRRRELSLHFLMLGSLRYNRADIFNILGRLSMIPRHELREYSWFYQDILQEGREEGREEVRGVIVEMLDDLLAKRFPTRDFTAEIERVRDVQALKQLYFDLEQIHTAEELQARLTKLAQQN